MNPSARAVEGARVWISRCHPLLWEQREEIVGGAEQLSAMAPIVAGTLSTEADEWFWACVKAEVCREYGRRAEEARRLAEEVPRRGRPPALRGQAYVDHLREQRRKQRAAARQRHAQAKEQSLTVDGTVV